MLTRRGFLTATAAGAATVARGPRTGFAQTAPVSVKRGGTLTAAIFADPLTFDPHFTGNLQGRAATRAIHDTLLRVNAQGRLAPGLVESWEQTDDKTFVLRLRDTLKFHDGTPLDATAVKFNIDRIRDPKTTAAGGIRAGEISTLDTVEVVDGRTFKLTLKSPFAAFLFPFTDVTGCVGSPAAFQKWGADYGLHPVGAGPFRMTEYAKDSRTVLEKNGDYWDKSKPYLDRVMLRPIPTDSTRLAELRAGGVQLAEALPLQDVSRLRQSKEIVVSEKVGFRWEYFGFNLAESYPGRAKKFRQAFQWAIDREALHQVAYFGTGSIGYDGIMPGSPFHDASYKPFTRDLNMAKKLIDGIGNQPPPSPSRRRCNPIRSSSAPGSCSRPWPRSWVSRSSIEQVDSAGYRRSACAPARCPSTSSAGGATDPIPISISASCSIPRAPTPSTTATATRRWTS